MTSNSPAISRCPYPKASRSTYTARSFGVSRSNSTSGAMETPSRRSAESSGPSVPSPVRTGSGSQGPTYSSRRARAEVSRLRHSRVTVLANQAPGGAIGSRSAPFHRNQASCTTSSASWAEPSMR